MKVKLEIEENIVCEEKITIQLPKTQFHTSENTGADRVLLCFNSVSF